MKTGWLGIPSWLICLQFSLLINETRWHFHTTSTVWGISPSSTRHPHTWRVLQRKCLQLFYQKYRSPQTNNSIGQDRIEKTDGKDKRSKVLVVNKILRRIVNSKEQLLNNWWIGRINSHPLLALLGLTNHPLEIYAPGTQGSSWHNNVTWIENSHFAITPALAHITNNSLSNISIRPVELYPGEVLNFRLSFVQSPPARHPQKNVRNPVDVHQF